MILTEEQKTVVRALIKGRDSEQIQTLGGYAGTGKSTIVRHLHEALNDMAVCAFTGKAANVLRKKGIDGASTIHSLIYVPETQPDGTVIFYLKDHHELAFKGFIVDEASMVSKEIYGDLVSYGMPIIFVGDHGQLEPVGSDVNVMADPQYRLEQVHRNAGEIAHFAEHIRKGNLSRTFKADAQVEFIEPSSVSDKLLTNNDQIICAFNKFRVEKNDHIRELLGHKGMLVEGERIMCLRNNKGLGIFNGMQGTVKKLYKKKTRIDFHSDGVTYMELMYDSNQFGKEKNEFEFGRDTPNPFDYAYCITCHKSQGDEWNNVLVYEQECKNWEHKRWAYTAASRARNKLYWVAPKRHLPDWL